MENVARKVKAMEIVALVGGSREDRVRRSDELVSEGYTMVDAERMESDKLSQYVVYARTQGVKPVVVVAAGSNVAAEAIFGSMASDIKVPFRIVDVDGEAK